MPGLALLDVWLLLASVLSAEGGGVLPPAPPFPLPPEPDAVGLSAGLVVVKKLLLMYTSAPFESLTLLHPVNSPCPIHILVTLLPFFN